MTEPSETRLVLWVLAQLCEHYPDSLFVRQNVAAVSAGDRFVRAGTPGQADIRGCHRGHYIELEVKRPGKKQQPNQRAHEARVTKAGGTYAVVCNPLEAFAIVDTLQ